MEQNQIMNKKLQKKCIEFIDDILILDIWKNNDNPIFFTNSLATYFQENKEYLKFKNDSKYSLLIDTLEEYGVALAEGWLPDNIVTLNIKQAYNFLNGIKDIIVNIKDDNLIEIKLIDLYNQNKKDGS